MYNEQLEQLIEAALKDGVLSEREKQVLFFEAESQGIDLREFEDEINQRLQIKKGGGSRTQEKFEKVARKKQSYWDQEDTDDDERNEVNSVKDCVDNAAVSGTDSFQSTRTKADNNPSVSNPQGNGLIARILNMGNKSSVRLNNMINDIINENYYSVEDCESLSDFRKLKKQQKRVKEALVQFPTPTEKDDLVDFMLFLKPKIRDSEYSDAYLMKYNECVDKVNFLYPNDPDFQKITSSKVKQGHRWGRFKGGVRKTGLVFGKVLEAILIIAFIAFGIWVVSWFL